MVNLTQPSAVSQLTIGNVAYSKWSPVISRQKIYCVVRANRVNRDDDNNDGDTVKGEEEKEEEEEGEEEGRRERRTRRKMKRMR